MAIYKNDNLLWVISYEDINATYHSASASSVPHQLNSDRQQQKSWVTLDFFKFCLKVVWLFSYKVVLSNSSLGLVRFVKDFLWTVKMVRYINSIQREWRSRKRNVFWLGKTLNTNLFDYKRWPNSRDEAVLCNPKLCKKPTKIVKINTCLFSVTCQYQIIPISLTESMSIITQLHGSSVHAKMLFFC